MFMLKKIDCHAPSLDPEAAVMLANYSYVLSDFQRLKQYYLLSVDYPIKSLILSL